MIISYLNGAFVRVQWGELVIAVNPPAKDSKLKPPRFGADIALISRNHPDFNDADSVTHGERKPFVIAGPGEYEVKGVVIRGFSTGSNTVYTLLLEGMTLLFLGAPGSAKLSPALKEALDEIDILFVPIGGEGLLSASDAHKLSAALEPRLIIPLPFCGKADAGTLKQFLKEAGEEKAAPVEKLTLKKKDLEGKEGEVVVLSPGA